MTVSSPRSHFTLPTPDGNTGDWGNVLNEVFAKAEAMYGYNPYTTIIFASGSDGSGDTILRLSGGDSGAHYCDLKYTTSGTLEVAFDGGSTVFQVTTGGVDFEVGSISGADNIYIDADGSLYFGADYLQHNSVDSQLLFNGDATRYLELDTGNIRGETFITDTLIYPGSSGSVNVGSTALPYLQINTDYLRLNKDDGQLVFNDDSYLVHNTSSGTLSLHNSTLQLTSDDTSVRTIKSKASTALTLASFNGTYYVSLANAIDVKPNGNGFRFWNSDFNGFVSGGNNVGTISSPFNYVRSNNIRLNSDGSQLVFNDDNSFTYNVGSSSEFYSNNIDIRTKHFLNTVTESGSTNAEEVNWLENQVKHIIVDANWTPEFSNFPASGIASRLTLVVEQDGTGGYSVTWPAEVKWPGGTSPTETTTPGAVDVYELITYDGGVTILGYLNALNFS